MSKIQIRKILKHETVSYLIVGVMTTLVDYVVFAIVNEILKRVGAERYGALAATAAAWCVAVVFAFFANKYYVFKSGGTGVRAGIRQFRRFVRARVISGLLVMLMMCVLVNLMRSNEYLSKILTSLINIVINYAASKFWIFRKKQA